MQLIYFWKACNLLYSCKQEGHHYHCVSKSKNIDCNSNSEISISLYDQTTHEIHACLSNLRVNDDRITKPEISSNMPRFCTNTIDRVFSMLQNRIGSCLPKKLEYEHSTLDTAMTMVPVTWKAFTFKKMCVILVQLMKNNLSKLNLCELH